MGNPAVDAMVKILEPLHTEYIQLKETLDAASGKRTEAKSKIISEITTDGSEGFVLVELTEILEKAFGDGPSSKWAYFREHHFAKLAAQVNEMADGYIDTEMSGKFKAISGDSETLRAKAKEIKEKYEALAASVKILDAKVTVEDLPKLGSGGRPAGTGKHQVNKGRFTFFVNDVEQSATKISTVLLSASAKCGGSGTNGSYSVKEFMTLLKEQVPGLQSEYDKDWSITLKNGTVLSGKRKMEVEEGGE